MFKGNLFPFLPSIDSGKSIKVWRENEKLKHYVRFILLLIFFTQGILACSAVPTPTDGSIFKKQGYLEISPVNLFTGEEAKYKPFMGEHVGDVHIRYEGKKSKLQVDIEIWENGAKTKTIGWLATPILNESTHTGKFDGDLLFSAKKGTNKYQITYAIADKNGSVSSDTTVDKKENYILEHTLILKEAEMIKDSESSVVFGLQATDEHGLSTFGNMQNDIQEAKWAVVFRVSAGDE
jgi:hypothetical protein